MITRELPREEWGKLEGNGNPSVLGFVEPDDVRMVVIEDDGKILGAMAVLRIVHLENLWLSPEVRGNAGAARKLIKGTMNAAREWSKEWLMASVGDDTIAGMVERVGGRKVPVDTYVLSVR